ncbi:transcription factor bHLH91-like [Silene latifolia]|uniref:transcription factor bHLH91-like n=1 Tax=Silene latifolia TaxID=37657 RepID=UPI003D785545
MYENETEIAAACFDPNNNNNITSIEQNGFSQIIDHNNNFNNHTSQEMDSTSMELEYQNNTNIIHDTNTNNNICYPQYDENIIHTTTSDLLNLLHLPRCSFAPSSSTAFLPPPTPSMSFVKPSSPPPVNLSFIGDMIVQDNNNNASGSSSLPNISYDPIAAATLPYDPLFHLNLPPQPSPLFRDLMFQSLPHPHGSSIIPTRGNHNNGTLFGHMDDNGDGNNVMNMNMNGLGGLYQENGVGEQMMNTNNGMFEFTRGGGSLDEGKLGKGPKNFVTERQRRQNFNDKYATLRSLIPTPTKADRASTVLDAINYINELKMTVRDLKLLVEKKRMSKERIKRLKTEDDDNDNNNNNNNNPSDNAGELNGGNGVEGSAGLVKHDPDDGFVGSSATQLRSSWLQRKCKDTEVDVRIVDDEVTIKLVQRKKINCLLSVSRTLDDLQLDLRHVAGGHVGDYYSYLFNSKICEGSSVYASAIANKLIEVVERQYAAASVAAAPSTSF